MGAISWARVAKRFVGMDTGQEYPHLEAMLEREAAEPHFDYRLLARILPPMMAAIGIVTFIPAMIYAKWSVAAAGAIFACLSYGLWWFLDRLDKTIPRSRAKLRRLAELIWQRYNGISNLVGIEPSLSSDVAEILEEAARLYQKHLPKDRRDDEPFGDVRLKASRAMEEAMAKLLQLAEPETVRSQELELEKGWARPLLAEMAALDQTLDQHMQTTLADADTGALAGLRDVRLELQRIDAAVDELKVQ
jgi:hypothetical protein